MMVYLKRSLKQYRERLTAEQTANVCYNSIHTECGLTKTFVSVWILQVIEFKTKNIVSEVLHQTE